jgi:predicted HAD superfamily Cof-like phosphohydrolase
MEKYTIFDDMCILVSNFNYLFGVIEHNYNPKNTNVFYSLFDKTSINFNEKQFLLRVRLINEEVNELKDAYKENNVIEIIDALCDILYVVCGAKIYFNLPNKIINNRLEFLMDENLTYTNIINTNEKIQQLNNRIHRSLLINDIENIIYYNNMLFQFANNFINNSNDTNFNDLNCGEGILIYDSLLDNIIINVFTISNLLEINIYELFKIVHMSNMSKICNNLDDANETITYILNQPNNIYNSPTYRKIILDDKEYYIIYDVETNKILKNKYYIPVSFI